MHTGGDAQFEGLGPVLAAPRVRRADPEHLLAGVVEAGQTVLHAVATHPLVVREVRLLDAAVVRDVLALGVDAVQL